MNSDTLAVAMRSSLSTYFAFLSNKSKQQRISSFLKNFWLLAKKVHFKVPASHFVLGASIILRIPSCSFEQFPQDPPRCKASSPGQVRHVQLHSCEVF